MCKAIVYCRNKHSQNYSQYNKICLQFIFIALVIIALFFITLDGFLGSISKILSLGHSSFFGNRPSKCREALNSSRKYILNSFSRDIIIIELFLICQNQIFPSFSSISSRLATFSLRSASFASSSSRLVRYLVSLVKPYSSRRASSSSGV